MKKILFFLAISLSLSGSINAAVELDADANGATDIGKGGTNSTTAAQAATNLGVGITSNPSFASIHASGGNLAAANKQVTKAWMSSASIAYTADVTSVIHGGYHWICKLSHTSNATGAEPGVPTRPPSEYRMPFTKVDVRSTQLKGDVHAVVSIKMSP